MLFPLLSSHLIQNDYFKHFIIFLLFLTVNVEHEKLRPVFLKRSDTVFVRFRCGVCWIQIRGLLYPDPVIFIFLRGFVPNLMVLLVITIFERFLPISEGFVPILLDYYYGIVSDLRYLFYFRNSDVIVVPIFRSFVPVCERFVPILIVLYLL